MLTHRVCMSAQALSHLALDALQLGATLAILWVCLRAHRARPREDGWFRLALRPPAKWLVRLLKILVRMCRQSRGCWNEPFLLSSAHGHRTASLFCMHQDLRCEHRTDTSTPHIITVCVAGLCSIVAVERLTSIPLLCMLSRRCPLP